MRPVLCLLTVLILNAPAIAQDVPLPASGEASPAWTNGNFGLTKSIGLSGGLNYSPQIEYVKVGNEVGLLCSVDIGVTYDIAAIASVGATYPSPLDCHVIEDYPGYSVNFNLSGDLPILPQFALVLTGGVTLSLPLDDEIFAGLIASHENVRRLRAEARQLLIQRYEDLKQLLDPALTELKNPPLVAVTAAGLEMSLLCGLIKNDSPLCTFSKFDPGTDGLLRKIFVLSKLRRSYLVSILNEAARTVVAALKTTALNSGYTSTAAFLGAFKDNYGSCHSISVTVGVGFSVVPIPTVTVALQNTKLIAKVPYSSWSAIDILVKAAKEPTLKAQLRSMGKRAGSAALSSVRNIYNVGYLNLLGRVAGPICIANNTIDSGKQILSVFQAYMKD